LGGDLNALLQGFTPLLIADARDAALLALGWAGALRRSELVGLDWQRRGEGLGSVSLEDERGLVIRLATSKGSQTEAVEVVVPKADMPTACAALAHWAQCANLQPGDPLFCPIDKGQRLQRGRLTGRSVARIVNARLRALAQARGHSRADARRKKYWAIGSRKGSRLWPPMAKPIWAATCADWAREPWQATRCTRTAPRRSCGRS
jgi:site-specific recombinase XerC